MTLLASLGCGACAGDDDATKAVAQPQGDRATVVVEGAAAGTYRLMTVTSQPVPGGQRTQVTFSSSAAELVVEVPGTSGAGSLTAVRVGDYYIGDCPIFVNVGQDDLAGSFDCPNLTTPEDVSRSIAVSGRFNATRRSEPNE